MIPALRTLTFALGIVAGLASLGSQGDPVAVAQSQLDRPVIYQVAQSQLDRPVIYQVA